MARGYLSEKKRNTESNDEDSALQGLLREFFLTTYHLEHISQQGVQNLLQSSLNLYHPEEEKAFQGQKNSLIQI